MHAAAQSRAAAVRAQLEEATARLTAVEQRQRALEEETAAVTKRIGEIDARMSSGAVTASRDLVAMQGEIDHLRTRQGEFEERTLEAMEEREPIEAEVASLREQLDALEAEVASAAAALETAEAAVVAELAEAEPARAAAVEGIPAPLLAEYERLRGRLGGVGAAPLVGSSCGGCHLTLPATEVARIKTAAPDELITCEQCGRILVRTS